MSDSSVRAREILGLLKERRESISVRMASVVGVVSEETAYCKHDVPNKDFQLTGSEVKSSLRPRNILDDLKLKRASLRVALDQIAARSITQDPEPSVTSCSESTTSGCSLDSFSLDGSLSCEEERLFQDECTEIPENNDLKEKHGLFICPYCYSDDSSVSFEDKCPAGKFCT